ncbi:Signal transduction histidine kinase [Geodermatophilus dictyosporus]|uniref:histidine kinase n=1 Tax=Geodermatophilus dictyosporus TaxID=1523247 RepID=A0A1I5SID7_9ACTN|nr:histidine kinase [Geodermatophilus dictyosporus]SFP70483.1 Signal transduction histidine kinase [Geodermatophilus dictyosporus]
MEGSTGVRAPSDRVYALVAVVSAGAAALEGPPVLPVLVCLVLALVPWLLVAAGADLPLALFAVLAVAPVVPVVAWSGVGSALFLTIATAARVATRTDRRGLLAATTAAAVAVPFAPFAGLLPPGAGEVERGAGSLYFAFGTVLGVLVGVLLHRAAVLTDHLRVAQERLAEAAARQERQRIARDVHDLVAHSLTVVVLHVGGARRVLRRDPRAAEGALEEAERVCRESLDGIRGVVGLLRSGQDEYPVVSLDLAELADGYRAAGLPVTLHTAGSPGSLPLVARVTLHRVVQEALANAARHADGAPVEVRVTVDDGGVEARVRNDLPGGGHGGGGHGGFGLVGLRERVASLGGELTWGPEDGAWVLRCALPRHAGDRAVSAPAGGGQA